MGIGVRTAAAVCLMAKFTAAMAQPTCVPTPITPLPAPITTSGSVTTRAGKIIGFTIDAGLLRITGGGVADAKSVYNVPPEDTTKPPATATMSYYAYAAKAVPGTVRPLIFIWDGGPGTSTRSMLLDSFGPILIAAPARSSTGPSTNPVRPDSDTLLDVADLVFVDAPGTGFGHLEGCDAARTFYGVDQDAAAFQRFITKFVQAYHRENAPLVLLSESYGTVRAAVVARRLADAGAKVSGLVLISQLMALDAWSDGSRANPGTENAAFLTLPTYAATAWWHGKSPHVGTLEERLREVERFSLDTYAPALLQGTNLSNEAGRALAVKLAYYTGLTAQTWLDSDFRIEGTRFRELLEARDHKLVGREDTRNDGPAPVVKGSAVEDDPTLALAHAAREAAFDAYVRGTLKLGDRPFTPYIDGPDTRWNMHHLTDPAAWPDTYLNVAPDLVSAMTREPGMRVLVVGGYFDLAAPYFGSPYLIAHLHLPEDARPRLQWKEYPAGHSVYEVDTARRDMHDRIAGMLTEAASPSQQ